MVLRMADHELYRSYVSGAAGPQEVIKKMKVLPRGTQFMSERSGTLCESCLITGMADPAAANCLIEEYREKAKDPALSEEEHFRLNDVLRGISFQSGLHGSPIPYLLKKIEVAQRFK